jgi:hypothetical protein
MPTLKTPRSAQAGRRGGALRPPAGRRNGKPKRSTAKILLRHAGSWVGGDLEARLAEAYAARARANF